MARARRPALPDRDWLRAMYVMQKDLQVTLHDGQFFDEWSMEQRLQAMMVHAFSLTSELHEAFQEIGWKPWATKKFINSPAFHSELVDTFKFFLNLMLLSGMTPKDLLDGFMDKTVINIERHTNGYDGVSTKCPVCKKEYADKGVECSPGVHVDPATIQTELILDVEPVRVPRRRNDARRTVQKDDAGNTGQALRLGGRTRSRNQ